MYTSEHNLESVRDLFFWNCAKILLLNCLKVTGKLNFLTILTIQYLQDKKSFWLEKTLVGQKDVSMLPIIIWLGSLIRTRQKLKNTANSDSVTSAKCCYLWTIRVLPSFPFCVKNCLMHKIIVWYFLPHVLSSINL